MHSKLGEWNGHVIESYGVLNLASAFLCVAVLAALLRFRRQNAAAAIDLTLLMVLGYLVGGKLLYVVLSTDWAFFTHFSSDKLEGGLWGGQLGFGILAGAYLSITRAPFPPLADALAVAWALITVPQKIGCFLGGCCHGSPSTLPWAVTFPLDGQCNLPGQPLHPTQLYDAASALALGILLLVAFVGRRGEGRLLLWWGVGYAVTKFASEWFRGDGRFILAGPVTAAMVVEIVAGAGCAFLIARPGMWNSLLAWRSRRSAEFVRPAGAVGRSAPFFLALSGFLVAALAAGVAGRFLDWPGAPFVILFGLYALSNLLSEHHALLKVLNLRIADARGAAPSAARLLIRSLFDALAPMTLFGLIRPLLDSSGRSLGDAAAGTWLVRTEAKALPVAGG